MASALELEKELNVIGYEHAEGPDEVEGEEPEEEEEEEEDDTDSIEEE
ncbi:MAG: hypothetical protein HY435_00855 [Candidatus Liptonbacteria bacterium]|nr:hypothetical protein [Candidatus Liptonbacteria bacterium]